jgi:hypothetical protein
MGKPCVRACEGRYDADRADAATRSDGFHQPAILKWAPPTPPDEKKFAKSQSWGFQFNCVLLLPLVSTPH